MMSPYLQRTMRLAPKMAAAGGEEPFVPDMSRRKLMNNILLTSVGATVSALAFPYLAFFVPVSSGGG